MKLIANIVVGILLMTSSLVASAFSETQVIIKNNDYSRKDEPHKCYLRVANDETKSETGAINSGFIDAGSSTTVITPYVKADSKDYIKIECDQMSPTEEGTFTYASLCDLPGNSCKPVELSGLKEASAVSVTIPQGFYEGSAAK